ncbi:ABC transporter permease [Plantibacter sp. ME-Dv--P-122b]|uniref:ABC transporter permease n=1 Tax=Plantibacter sp. ME-Dv--P-122b TaxID=3040300 RepID=UPI00254B68CE|nr:ABC transporter permease [Plantibacter sp. ME-Dv--P-122b]
MTATPHQTRAARVTALPLLPVGSSSGFFAGTSGSIRDIWAHRELLGLLVKREVRAKYKDSSLGLVWSLFRPIVQLLIYFLAIGQVLGLSRQVPDFAVFVFVGLTMWALFNEVVTSSTSSIVGNSGIVKKVYLPREIFPLSSVGTSLFNFLIQLVVLIAAVAFLSDFVWSLDILLAPLAVVTLVVFAFAIGLMLAAANVYLRDVQHLVELALMVLFWASPIVYSFTFVHKALGGNWLEQLYLANPVTTCIIAMQKALWSAGTTAEGSFAQVWPEDLALRLGITLAISLVLLWIAQRVFSRYQGNFAQEL